MTSTASRTEERLWATDKGPKASVASTDNPTKESLKEKSASESRFLSEKANEKTPRMAFDSLLHMPKKGLHLCWCSFKCCDGITSSHLYGANIIMCRTICSIDIKFIYLP